MVTMQGLLAVPLVNIYYPLIAPAALPGCIANS